MSPINSPSKYRVNKIKLPSFDFSPLTRFSQLSLTCLTPEVESPPSSVFPPVLPYREIKSILELPSEIITGIFSFLDLETLVRLRLVCKMFETLVFTAYLWKDIDIQFDRNWKYATELMKLVSRSGSVIRKLQVENVRDDIVREILDVCPNLEELKLKKWTTLSDHAFFPLEKNQMTFRKLKKIEIIDNNGLYSAITASSVILLAKSAPNLEEFHIWCMCVINSRAIEAIAMHNPKLRVLSISSAQLLTNNDITRLVQSCPRLSYLALSHCRTLSDSVLRSLGQFAQSLKTLILHGGSNLTDQGVQHLAGCKELIHVKFFDCRDISIGVMDTLGFESVLFTPLIHRPCFKVGIGFGYRRSCATASLRPSPLTPPPAGSGAINIMVQ